MAAFVVLGLVLPFAVLRATLEGAYQAGPILPPGLLGWGWLVLIVGSVLVGIWKRDIAIARVLLIGTVASVVLLGAVVGVFLLNNP